MKTWTEGWHFLPADRRLRNGDGRLVVAGETLRIGGEPILYERGFHASESARDALEYAPGPIVQRVVLGGRIAYDHDKAVATERTCLWIADATPVLHEFAVRCAEAALIGEAFAGRRVDERSIAALVVKRSWMRGEATDEELAAARAAARTAWYDAWDAASDAARTAAGDAGDAWDAAWAAARAAAGDAWAAARAAARAAAWDDARAEQSRLLESMLMGLAPA